jgi:probable F420-dependent oxidoreductase
VTVPVSVQASPRDLASWLELARRLEGEGFSALLCADHPGAGPSPFPALAAAATVTTTLRLGTYVVQGGVREAHHVAVDAATLDLFAPGRVSLGVGAGHTPAEWRAVGRTRPGPRERAERAAEMVAALAALLRGEEVTTDSAALSMEGARLIRPVPAGAIELVVGGGNPALLRAGARHGDVVALSGLGLTLEDGHAHEARWRRDELRRQIDLVGDAARAAGREVALEALVQVVEVTADREIAVAAVHAEVESASLEDLRQTPFILVGTEGEIAEQLVRQGEELGISRVVVREPAVPALASVLARLAR